MVFRQSVTGWLVASAACLIRYWRIDGRSMSASLHMNYHWCTGLTYLAGSVKMLNACLAACLPPMAAASETQSAIGYCLGRSHLTFVLRRYRTLQSSTDAVVFGAAFGGPGAWLLMAIRAAATLSKNGPANEWLPLLRQPDPATT